MTTYRLEKTGTSNSGRLLNENGRRVSWHSLTMMSIDAALIITSFYLALLVGGREIADIHYRWYEYVWMFTVLVAVKLFVFERIGFYKEIIRFASMDFAVRIVKATVFGSLVSIGMIHIVRPELGLPVLIVDWMASCILIGASRFGMRYMLEVGLRRTGGRNTILYGAGEHGVAVARHLLRNEKIGSRIIGFIDDDLTKYGKKIQGIQVIGNMDGLSKLLKEQSVQEVVVTFANAEGELVKRLFRLCREHSVRCRIVPGMADVISGKEYVRNIDIADLMRRPQRNLDREMIGEFLRGRRVLITGAAGSIGSEIFRQTLDYEPASVVALDHSEYGLYRLNEEFSRHEMRGRCHFSLVDIKSRELVDHALQLFSPDVVFHAAAYKHVPILEQDVKQAVLNNVSGLRNVIDVSERHGVKKFVFISTDKAVRPTNVMGATKRIGELISQVANGKDGMKCISVRFGNVLASSGSVVPKFIEQIKTGGPVTVTHKEVTRYFMLIPEAVELVLQAGSLGDGGEVFVLNMGKPVRITEMAEDLISLMGHVPHAGIPIEYTGLRPGEKLHEELFLDEIECKTPFEDINIGKARKLDSECLEKKLNELLDGTMNGNVEEIKSIIQRIVPEYRPDMGVGNINI